MPEMQGQTEIGPFLKFRRPIDTKVRFRYLSELKKGLHGSLKSIPIAGRRAKRPEIELYNYSGVASMRATLLTPDGLHHHVHKLVPGVRSQNIDISFQFSGSNPMVAELQNVSIVKNGALEVTKLAQKVISGGAAGDVSREDKEESVKLYRDQINNAVILCIDAVDATGNVICESLLSEKITHTKDSSALNITRLSSVSDLAKGGQEIYLLCSEVNFGDIEVHFYQRSTNWFKEAEIVLVHRKACVVVKVPQYSSEQLESDVTVHLQLYRPSDEERSSEMEFTYIVDTTARELHRKRKKVLAGNFTVQDTRVAAACDNAPARGLQMYIPSNVPELPVSVQEEPRPPHPTEGLKSDSRDPFLSGIAADLTDEQLNMSCEEVEETFDETVFASFDSLPRAAIRKEGMCIVNESASGFGNTMFDSLAISSLDQDGLQIAYKLALSTARALHEFSRTGDVRFLLTSMRHLIAVQDEHGDNAIHSSVIHAQEVALHNLVEVARTVADFDILNMYNEIKQTPLHIGVCVKQARMIRTLLYHGADPNVCDSHGNTPIHLASQQQANSKCLEELLDTQNYLEKYKNHAPDLNVYNYAGFTALHLAVMAGNEEAAKTLCRKNCNVDLVDRTVGRSALHLAVENNNIELIRFFLEEAGADPDATMFNGNTPLHLACARDSMKAIGLLVQAQADPYLENLERAEASEGEDSDNEEAETDDDDDDVQHGLTSLDLASSDEVRRLLRGELVAVPEVTEVQQQEVAVVMDENKPEKKPSVFDSGIGLSGTNLTCPDEIEDDSPFVADFVDDDMKNRLAHSLDKDKKWEKLAEHYQMNFLIKALKGKSTSPSLGLMKYIRMDKFKEALGMLNFSHELELLSERKFLSGGNRTSQMTAELSKHVEKMTL